MRRPGQLRHRQGPYLRRSKHRRGLGGCGKTPGENECKEKGDCHVPINDNDVWKIARKRFEEEMKKAEKKFGDAPKKSSGS
jgi:hypothetical protein